VKISGMLIISLRGVRVSMKKTLFSSCHMVSLGVALEEIIKPGLCPFQVVSFISQIKPEPCPHWFLSNFLTSIPDLFTSESPLGRNPS